MAICSDCHAEVYRYRIIDGKDYCFKCAPRGGTRNISTFPFVSTHIDGNGTPIVVESMHHLRKLERRYGVQSAAYNLSQAELNHYRP